MTAQNEDKMICEHGHYAPSCQKCETSNTYSGKAEELFLKVGASDLLIYAKQMERELVASQKREAELLAWKEKMQSGSRLVIENEQLEKTIEDLRTRLSTVGDELTELRKFETGAKTLIGELRTRLSGQTCYVPPEFQAEMDELKMELDCSKIASAKK